MAYIFADGFDNYTTPTQVWDSLIGTATISAANARFSSGSTTAQGIAISQNSGITKNFVNTTTIIVGFAYWVTTLGTNFVFTQFFDNGTVQCGLGVTNAGALQLFRGSGSGSPIGAASANGLIQNNSWTYVEIQITFSATVGTIQVWLNGGSSPVLNNTGLNNITTANAFCNQFRIGELSNQGILPKFDDAYIFDTTGTTQNAHLGDTKIITKMPSGAGASTQWTLNGAATNWQCVNEIPPNDDTSYVSDQTAGHIDLYATQSASLSGTVGFFVTRHRWRKDDANVHTIQPIIQSNVTQATGTTATLGSSYQYFDNIFVNDPNTAAPWLAAAADAAQIGTKDVS